MPLNKETKPNHLYKRVSMLEWVMKILEFTHIFYYLWSSPRINHKSLMHIVAVPSMIPKISGLEKRCVNRDVRQQNVLHTSLENCYKHTNYPSKGINSTSLLETKLLLQDKIYSNVPLQSIMKWSEVKLARVSKATTQRCRGGRYSFPWIAPLYPWYVPYIAEC